jgi:hypothetical protein
LATTGLAPSPPIGWRNTHFSAAKAGERLVAVSSRAELIRAVVRWLTMAGRVRDIVCGIELSSEVIFSVAVILRVDCIGVGTEALLEPINKFSLASDDSSNRQYRLLLPLPPAPVQRC